MPALLSPSATNDDLNQFFRADPLLAKYASHVAGQRHVNGALLFASMAQGSAVLLELLMSESEGLGLSNIAATSLMGRLAVVAQQEKPASLQDSFMQKTWTRRRSLSIMGGICGALGGTTAAAPGAAANVVGFSSASVSAAPPLAGSTAALGAAADLKDPRRTNGQMRRRSSLSMVRRGTQIREETGKAAVSHGDVFREVVITGRRSAQWRLSQLIPALLRLNPLTVIALGLGVYALCVALFAALFYAAGAECFGFSVAGAQFSFAEMLWFSVHTFSSVGYGSIYPTCSPAQVVVFFETCAPSARRA